LLVVCPKAIAGCVGVGEHTRLEDWGIVSECGE
jgi:hypothetical protein